MGPLEPGSGLTALELAIFFAVGLLGGAHCLGMCGPLVTLYSERMAGGGRGPSTRVLGQHLLLNLGRATSYAAIGAVMGGLGALVFNTATVVEAAEAVRGVVGIGVGLFVIGVGSGYTVRGRSTEAASIGILGSAFGKVYSTITGRVDSLVNGPGIFGLGMLHGFLPCPILYPAYLYALTMGSPFKGGIALGVLGLGTLPTLFIYGTVLESVSTATRRRLHRVLGVAFLVLGYLPLAMGLRTFGVPLPVPAVPIYQPLGGGGF
ncbi:MAG: sulfite exporter TauE/SafE family protein [Halodesulfurarchaeum sp.]